MTSGLLRVLAVGVLLVFVAGCDLNFGTSGRFVPAPPQPNPSDPPSRIARLSYLDGPVSFRAAGSGVWTPAVLNRPVTTGDELWTSTGARAELHLGFAAIRLDAGTDFGVLELSDNAFQAKLTQGAIRFTVLRLEHGDAFEIDTPNASITPSEAGEYRVEVSAKTNTTELIVRAGEAEVTNPSLAFEVPMGQQARVDHTKLLKRNVTPAPPADGFDQFCQMRITWKNAQSRKSTLAPASSERTIWTIAASGLRAPRWALIGHRAALRRVGRHTASAAGLGSNLGAGPGSMTRPGGSLRFTMAAGLRSTEHGPGYRGRRVARPFLRPHWWCSSKRLSLARSRGFLLGPKKSTFPRIRPASDISPG